MNGRIDKENSSNFTYFSKNSCSTVDYSLSCYENFGMIDKLSIGKICYLSDHSPIEISIKCSNTIDVSRPPLDVSDHFTNSGRHYELLKDYNKQYFIKDDSTLDNLTLAMRETEIIDFLDDISSQLDGDVVSSEEIVESLRNKMVDLSDTSLNSKKIFRTDKKSTNFKNKCPWFDIECKKNKSLLNNEVFSLEFLNFFQKTFGS